MEDTYVKGGNEYISHLYAGAELAGILLVAFCVTSCLYLPDFLIPPCDLVLHNSHPTGTQRINRGEIITLMG